VRYVRGGIDPEGMRLSAQLASSLAALLLVIPMFFLGKELFDRRVGFWGALIFQWLPVSAHVLSDGLSEALFLLFTASALLFAVHAVRGAGWRHYVLCGACTALSYLTRPEGALVALALGATMLGSQMWPAWRRSW